ncbi:hypothetical protein TMU01_30290 [Tenuibacillus multivorans]|nr:hypothetical protein TMU01_30290 [Tenuibacillus multivorans]
MLLISLFLIGCIPEENSDSRSALEGLSINWNIKLKKTGEYYKLVEQGLNENKSQDYFNGVHDSMYIIFKGSDLYDSVEDHVVNHFEDEVTESEGTKLHNIFLRLDNATFELNELLTSGQMDEINKEELSSQLTKLAEYMDVTGVSSRHLNLYNVIGNPQAVLREHSQSEILGLIDDFNHDLKELEELIDNP